METIRVALLSAAARSGLDVVSTLAYSHPGDRSHVERLVRASVKGGAEMRFVQLLPQRATLEQRVLSNSRISTSKIRDVPRLAHMLDAEDLTTRINPDDLSIDNTMLAPGEVVSQIATAFSL